MQWQRSYFKKNLSWGVGNRIITCTVYGLCVRNQEDRPTAKMVSLLSDDFIAWWIESILGENWVLRPKNCTVVNLVGGMVTKVLVDQMSIQDT